MRRTVFQSNCEAIRTSWPPFPLPNPTQSFLGEDVIASAVSPCHQFPKHDVIPTDGNFNQTGKWIRSRNAGFLLMRRVRGHGNGMRTHPGQMQQNRTKQNGTTTKKRTTMAENGAASTAFPFRVCVDCGLVCVHVRNCGCVCVPCCRVLSITGNGHARQTRQGTRSSC